ncbi:MAG: fumarate hydratase, partial [Christensenellaceae bacterium]|nr:fumarate hydratase [Christensenellaceae bacterium]
MRTINLSDVTSKVKEMFIDACENIPQNVLETIENACKAEESPLGKDVLGKIVENDLLARKEHLPICQDTGIAVVMLTIGSEVTFKGDIYEAVNEGVRQAYTEGYLRKSVVRHPLDRVNTRDNTPAIVHVKITEGDVFRIDVAPKGGGSENMSAIRMLVPADGEAGIKKFILDTVLHASGKPCPPIILGIGIGGNFEKSAMMAKEALFREIDDESPDPIARRLEKEIREEVNKLGVGPMGFGGT